MTGSGLKVISVKLPHEDVRRIRGNRSDFVRKAVVEKLARENSREDWKPRTAAVREMLRLREKFVRDGGQLLDNKGIAEELKSRRGGLD